MTALSQLHQARQQLVADAKATIVFPWIHGDVNFFFFACWQCSRLNRLKYAVVPKTNMTVPLPIPPAAVYCSLKLEKAHTASETICTLCVCTPFMIAISPYCTEALIRTSRIFQQLPHHMTERIAAQTPWIRDCSWQTQQQATILNVQYTWIQTS